MTMDDVMKITTVINEEFKSIDPQLLVSENPEGVFHIQCRGWTTDLADTSPIYQIGRIAIERLAKARKAFIRVPPEVTAEVDLASGAKIVRSYVRFSFEDVLGDWEIARPDGMDGAISFGL
jgi:hypothetical protein